MIRDAFRGRTLFVTGATGFVGKVLVEKILRDLDVHRIFLLSRDSKKLSAVQRIEHEIRDSPCFDKLRAQLGSPEAFKAMWAEKVVAVSGDLMLEDAGLSAVDRQRLVDEVQIIIHCAASVDFNQPLYEALRLNVMGALRMFEIAREARRLECFMHVSTAYVNCNRSGFVEERVYEQAFNPRELSDQLMAMSPEECEKASPRVLQQFGYPNTYTFVKYLTECLLIEDRKRFPSRNGLLTPLVIFRPSIIGASWRDPVPGWVDTVSAAGSLYLPIGLGMLRIVHSQTQKVGDQVPVDLCVNQMLACCADLSVRHALAVASREGSAAEAMRLLAELAESGKAGTRQGAASASSAVIPPVDLTTSAVAGLVPPPVAPGDEGVLIYQCGTSHVNPLPWDYAAISILKYWREHPPTRGIAPASVTAFSYDSVYQAAFFLRYRMPQAIVNMYQRTGSPAAARVAKNLERLLRVLGKLGDAFRHFLTNEWIYDTTNTLALQDRLRKIAPRDANDFDFDVTRILWTRYLMNFCYGLHRYVLRDENIDYTPTTETRMELLTQMNEGIFADLRWALYSSPASEPRFRTPAAQMSPVAALERIMQDTRVAACIEREAAARSVSIASVRSEVVSILKRIAGDMQMNSVRFFGWSLRKVWRQIYDGITVDQVELRRVREASRRGQLLFLPTHRSYVDFLLLSFVAFHYSLPTPFIAAGEDFLGMPFVSTLLRTSGAFFLRRSFQPESLYGEVFAAYVRFLVGAQAPIEFFVEGTRSRTGKMLHPKAGLLHMTLESLLTGTTDHDIFLVPVNIDYERVLETTLFPDEMLGKPKERESVSGLVRARIVLTQSFGRVNVRFGTIVSVRDQLNAYVAHATSATAPVTPVPAAPSPAATTTSAPWATAAMPSSAPDMSQLRDRMQFCRSLAYQVIYDLQNGTACMPPALLATLLVTIGQNGVFREQLPSLIEWLRGEAAARGAPMPFVDGDDESPNAVIESALRLLPDQIVVAANLVYPAMAVSLRDRKPTIELHRNGLVLAYYRNQIIHLFVPEAIVATALNSFASASTAGVRLSVLMEEVLFLHSLFSVEFVVQSGPDPRRFYQQTIAFMVENGTLTRDGDASSSSAADTTDAFDQQHGDPVLRVDVSSENGARMTLLLLTLIAPFVDAYATAVRSLSSMLLPAGASSSAAALPIRLTMSRIMSALQQSADAAFHAGEMALYESCSVATLRNVISVLQKWRVIGSAAAPAAAPPAAPPASGDKTAAASKAPAAKSEAPTSEDMGQGEPEVSGLQLLEPYTQYGTLSELVNRVTRFRLGSWRPATPTGPIAGAVATATLKVAARL